MTHFKRLTQALPSYRTLCEHHCRTKLSPLSQYHLLVRPGLPVALRVLQPSFLAIRSTSKSSHPNPDRGTTESVLYNEAADEIIFSVDQPPDLPARVTELLPTWHVSASKKGITRQFTFSSFAKAWKFMTLVADECKIRKHHPSWSNLYNQVTMEWTTHKPEGLSIKDVEMAEFCNQIADEIGLKK